MKYTKTNEQIYNELMNKQNIEDAKKRDFTHIVSFEASNGKKYTVTIYPCEAKYGIPEDLAAERIKRNSPGVELKHIGTVKVGGVCYE